MIIKKNCSFRGLMGKWRCILAVLLTAAGVALLAGLGCVDTLVFGSHELRTQKRRCLSLMDMKIEFHSPAAEAAQQNLEMR